MKTCEIVREDREYHFANPESLTDWFRLKVAGYVRHYTVIGKCYLLKGLPKERRGEKK